MRHSCATLFILTLSIGTWACGSETTKSTEVNKTTKTTQTTTVASISQEPARGISTEGESCAKSADCIKGLRCIKQTCVKNAPRAASKEKTNPFRNLDSKKKPSKIKELMNNSESSAALDNLPDIIKPSENPDFKALGIADSTADPGEKIDPFGDNSGGYEDVGIASIGFDQAGSGGGRGKGLEKKRPKPRKAKSPRPPNTGKPDLSRVIRPKVIAGRAQVSGHLDRAT